MLLTDGAPSAIPVSDEWIYEVKFDGFRVLMCRSDGDSRLVSRKGFNFTRHFPSLAQAARTLADWDTILDGEVIAHDGTIASFNELRRWHGYKHAQDAHVTFIAFDILRAGGAMLVDLPLRERRAELERVASGVPEIVISHWFSDGRTLYEEAVDRGYEGVIGKRLDSKYEPGRRSRNWVKYKSADAKAMVRERF